MAIGLSTTLPTLAAAVADEPHTAAAALRSKIRLIELFLRNGIAPGIRQLEVDGFALKAQAGTGCLLAPQLAVPGAW